MKGKSIFIGQEGHFYLMYQLAKHGIHAASTHGNAPFIDILASAPDGRKSVAIQVKTTSWALRWRGRGANRAPDHLEFPLGYSAAVTAHPDLIIAFIDLRKSEQPTIPDIYFVPSLTIKDFWSAWIENAKMVRWHPPIGLAAQFKNNWAFLSELLELSKADAIDASPEDKVEELNPSDALQTDS
jgi:hypothetical protein